MFGLGAQELLIILVIVLECPRGSHTQQEAVWTRPRLQTASPFTSFVQ